MIEKRYSLEQVKYWRYWQVFLDSSSPQAVAFSSALRR